MWQGPLRYICIFGPLPPRPTHTPSHLDRLGLSLWWGGPQHQPTISPSVFQKGKRGWETVGDPCPPLTHPFPFLPERERQGECHMMHSCGMRTDTEMVTCVNPFALHFWKEGEKSESVTGKDRRHFPLPASFCGKGWGALLPVWFVGLVLFGKVCWTSLGWGSLSRIPVLTGGFAGLVLFEKVCWARPPGCPRLSTRGTRQAPDKPRQTTKAPS